MMAVTHMIRKSSTCTALAAAASKPGATSATVAGASTKRTPTTTIMMRTDAVSTVRAKSLGRLGLIAPEACEDGHEGG